MERMPMIHKNPDYPNLSELQLAIIRELLRVWNLYPDLRFGQIVACAKAGQPTETRNLYLLDDEAALHGFRQCRPGE
jgi:hypothetical protein